jgi:hypothetical protein
MAKWKLLITEKRTTIFEVEAATAEEGMKICLSQPDKCLVRIGTISARLVEAQDITNQRKPKENLTQEAAMESASESKNYPVN